MGIIMRVFIISLVLCFVSISANAQKYSTYQVKDNEDLKVVAQKYDVSVTDILNFNPDISRYKQLEGETLVIPLSDEDDNIDRFESYEVEPKETLYSIAKAYEVEMETIIKYNPFLKTRDLDYNDVLEIPILKIPKDIANQSVKNSTFSNLKHLVQSKETKFGIAKDYGLTVEELERLNPNVDVIHPGDYLLIERKKKEEPELPKDREYKYVKVDSESDLDALQKGFKVTDELISELNPAYKYTGIGNGIVLKLPTDAKGKEKRLDLSTNFSDPSPKKIGLFLPFNLKRFKGDTVDVKKQLMDNRITRVSLDLYEGAQAAVDSARKLGIKVDLRTFDTGMDAQAMQSIIDKNNLSQLQAVIGPVTEPNVRKLSQALSKDSIPILLPITESSLSGAHIFNSLPNEAFREEMITTYIHQNITDDVNLSLLVDDRNSHFEQVIDRTFPGTQHVSMSESYLQKNEVGRVLQKEKMNWFVLDTDKLGIAEAAVSFLESYRKKGYDVKLIMPSKDALRNEISNSYLSNLKLLYTASSYDVTEYQLENKRDILKSRYFLRGYDLTMDVILRLAYVGDFYDAAKLDGFTEYYQNKFQYQYDVFEKIYRNTSAYLVEYQDDLKLDVIELLPQE